METDQPGNQYVTVSDDEVVDQDPDETLAYYLPKDELKVIAEYREGEQAQLPNLQYAINPIFRRDRWVEITDRQWTLVEPVLRLASAFFDTEASFIVLYSIINAPQGHLPSTDLTRPDKYEIRRMDPSKHYRYAREEFNENIALFGDNLWWRLTDIKGRGAGGEATECYGRTQRYDGRVFQYSNSDRKDIIGNGSLVYERAFLARAETAGKLHEYTGRNFNAQSSVHDYGRTHPHGGDFLPRARSCGPHCLPRGRSQD